MNDDYQRMIVDCQNELDYVHTKIADLPFDKINAYLNSYSVIRACSTIEYVFKHMLYDVTAKNTNEYAKKVLEKYYLKNSFNPKSGIVLEKMSFLNKEWSKNLKASYSGTDWDKAIEKLNSLVSLRNSFAHGTSINASIDQIIDEFDAGKKILYFIDEIVFNV